jgi:uncharacterized protein
MNLPAARPTWVDTLRRVVYFAPVRLVLGFVWMVLVLGVSETVALAPANPALALVGALVVAVVALLAYAGFVRLVERRPVSELSLAGAAGELGRGALLGLLLFSATIGLIALFGAYHVLGTNPWTAVLRMLAISITSGVTEELLFRGLVFRILEESLGSVLALVISGLIFGLLHMLNPNASLTAGLAIALEAGVLLGAVYMLTRRLWLAIGLHFAWNFAQGGLFGVPVSGMDFPGLLSSTLTGPDWLSGGAFGAEASIFAVLVCVGVSVYVLWRVRQRGGVVAPFWRRKPRA